jgi:PAS domain S-box-containing protein
MDLNKTRKSVFIVYFFSVLGFIILLTGSYINLRKADNDIVRLKKTMSQLTALQNISIHIKAIESGQRGFVISGNKDFLNSYYDGVNKIKADTAFLKPPFATNSFDKTTTELMLLIKNKIIFSEKVIALRTLYGDDSTASLISQKEGLLLMNNINEHLKNLINKQLNTINNYSKENKHLINKRFQNHLLLFLLLTFASIVTYIVFNKGFKEQIKNENLLKFNSALISNLYDPVITTDNDYLISSWNKNAERLFGYTEQEVMGKRLKDILQSKSENYSLDEIRNIITEKLRWNGDIIYTTKDNRTIYANVSTSLVFDESNNNNGTVSIIRDITDKKIAENKLQQLSDNLEIEVEKKVNEIKVVFERTTDAFVSFDHQLNYVFVNEKAAALHNSSVAEMTGKNIMFYTPKKSSPEFYEALLTVLKERKEIHNELNYLLTGQWFENWIYPDEHGVSVYYRDITERKAQEVYQKEANKKLEILNNRFELILKGTNDAIWDWDMTTNEIWGNDKYYQLLKNKPENKSNFEYFLERMHPGDSKKGMEILSDNFAEKKETMISEYRFLNSENKWIVLFNRQTILYNDEGKPYRILGALQDITDQKKIQEQIIHEKEMADVLINSLPGVFYMFNKEGKYIRWNKNLLDITGVTDEQMMSTANPVNFVPEEQRALFAEKIANVFKSGIDHVEGDLLVKDNQKIPFYFTGIFIKYNGEDCMMGVGIDISEKVKTQKELRDLATHLQNVREEERTRIAREIHDELGQQLTGLKMEISWLNKKIKPENIEVSNKLQDALFLIDDTVKNVRRIATQLRPSMLDDLGLLSAMEWQSDEFQKRFHIKSDIETNLGNVKINPEKSTAIFRIFQESLTNVLRHSKATAVNTLLTIEDDVLVMSITDNGIGFNETEINKKQSLGILGMKERTIMLGGSYQISSKENEGVMVLVKLPLDD